MAELLAPAGNPETLDAAVGEGADAVYLGLRSFNARMRSSNFTWAQFEAAVEALHKRNKKIFVTVNTVIEESELERMYRFLSYLNKIGPDALIVQDFGVVSLVHTCFPSLRIHASTQMNVSSAKAVNVLSRSGVSRVVLSRELGLEEIKAVKAATSCELEVFVHGALCVSESGLCLFSSYLGGKSANRGMCAQACRRLYSAEGGNGVRQGYFFSPHDLQLVDKIPDLIQTGVHSFKIEGRMKSAEYVGTAVSAYRYIIDNWEKDRKTAEETAKRILANDFARAKTRYWYDSRKAENVLNPDQPGGTGIYLGSITRTKSGTGKNGEKLLLAALSGNRYDPEAGDSIRLHKKTDEMRESWKIKNTVKDGSHLWIDIPEGFSTGDKVYLLQTKTMSKHYPHVLPNSLSKYRSQPGDEKLPPLDCPDKSPEQKQSASPKKGKKTEVFPEGIYVQVDSPQDFYQSLLCKPVRIVIDLNENTLKLLLKSVKSQNKTGPGNQEEKPALPVSKKTCIISLPPFLPQEREEETEKTISKLVDEGYSNFIANNIAHLGILRSIMQASKTAAIPGKTNTLNIAAGPYLYSFNSRAADWLTRQGVTAFISPYENSRKNLEAAFPKAERKRIIIPVFAYPALFRMRFDLPENYDFTWFYNKREEVFRAVSTNPGSVVVPAVPYSIADKKTLLTRLGFTRFLFDFTNALSSRKEFRAVMDSFHKELPLQEISRFNWKDGFYDPDKIEELKQLSAVQSERKKTSGGRNPDTSIRGRKSGANVKTKGRQDRNPRHSRKENRDSRR